MDIGTAILLIAAFGFAGVGYFLGRNLRREDTRAISLVVIAAVVAIPVAIAFGTSPELLLPTISWLIGLRTGLRRQLQIKSKR